MHPISQVQKYISNSELSKEDLIIAPPTRIVNIFFKIWCKKENMKSLSSLVFIFKNSGAETITIPFYFTYKNANYKYLVPGKNSINENFISNLITVDYSLDNEDNQEIEFEIEANYLSEKERAGYEKQGISALGGGQ